MIILLLMLLFARKIVAISFETECDLEFCYRQPNTTTEENAAIQLSCYLTCTEISSENQVFYIIYTYIAVDSIVQTKDKINAVIGRS